MSNPASSDERFVYSFQNNLRSDQLPGFQLLQKQLDQAAKNYKGYLGQELIYDSREDGLYCTANISFNSLQNCMAWLDSPVRRKILHQAEQQLSYSYQSGIDQKSFDQWIASKASSSTSIWKINLLVWLALYPSVMVLIIIGQTSLGKLHIALNMLISNAITVAVTGWFLVPWLSRVYGPWLNTRVTRLNITGAASVVGFLLLFLVVFSLLPLGF